MSELIGLDLEEISLVDKGDDPKAKVAIFKRVKEENMSILEKMDDEVKGRMQALMDKGYSEEDALKMVHEEMGKAEARVEELEKFLSDEGYDASGDKITKRIPEEMIEVDGEQIAKSAIPAAILTKMEKMEAEKAETELEKRASETLPNLNVGVAKKMLKAADEDKEIHEFLRSVDNMFSETFKEVGEKGNADLSSPRDKLNKMAEEYAAKHGVTFEKGYAEVTKTKEGREVYKAMQEDK